MRGGRLYPPAFLVGILPVLVIVLAGCGGGGSTTVVETVTETAPVEETTGGGETTGGEGTTAAEEETTTPEEEGGGGAKHLTSFQSPSGNIGCILFEGDARCDIDKHSWGLPPRPSSCPQQVDYGQGLTVEAGEGESGVVCAGDTAMNSKDPILAYGSTSEVNGTTCVSREDGVTCTNAAGHGFFISVGSYKLF